MSLGPSSQFCSSCKTKKSPSFFHYPSRITPYKTCVDCRSRRRARPNRPGEDPRSLDNDKLKPKYCKGCKRNCPSDKFEDENLGKTFQQCIDCRLRDHARRHPDPRQVQPVRPEIDRRICTNYSGMANCSRCKTNCDINVFYAHSSEFARIAAEKPFKTCLDCRTKDSYRRYPFQFASSAAHFRQYARFRYSDDKR